MYFRIKEEVNYRNFKCQVFADNLCFLLKMLIFKKINIILSADTTH